MKVRFALSVGLSEPDPDTLASVGAEAEEAGFDSLWLSDVPSLPSTEPTLGVAYLAAVTTRVRLGINLIPFGSAPYVVAHRAAQLDRLTVGRLLVTLVPGLDLPGEREALGTVGRHRGRLMEELVPQLRELWAEGLPVAPLQDPLEVWLGGSGPEAIGRAGRVADGWLGSLVSPRRAGQIRSGIQAAAAAAGRAIDPDHFGLSIGYARDAAGLEAAAQARIRVTGPRRPDLDPGVEPADLVPVGVDPLRRLIEQLVEEGLSKFVLRPLGPVGDWDLEVSWLADTVLGLQT